MRFLLGSLVVVFNLADNLTTFVCLRATVPGFEVVEANPFAAWLFASVGLAEGLVFETIVTTAAVCFLVASSRVSRRVRTALLVVLALLPAWAAINNLQVMSAIGIAFGSGS